LPSSERRRSRRGRGAGACWRFVDPARDGRTAVVFWDPAARPDVLQISLRPPLHPGEDRQTLSLAALPGRKALLVERDAIGGLRGRQHLWIRLATGDFQLVADTFAPPRPAGESLVATPVGTAPAIWEARFAFTDIGDRQLAALNRLRRGMGWAAGKTREPPALPTHRSFYVRYLRAFDLARAGTPQRAIAEALFSPAIVARHWTDPSNRLKRQLRYAVRQGEALVHGGYLNLLRRADRFA
jgi:hypothetical protein